jgi:NADH-quinone oxidoreductase subunit J
MLDKILFIMLLGAAVWTVMTTRLMKSIMGLAVTSVMVSVILFRLKSPLAAVFELSVCAGLISVIFITAVSFTERLGKAAFQIRRRERFQKFQYLFLVLAIAALALWGVRIPLHFELPAAPAVTDTRVVLWNLRPLDLFGQIVVLLAGAFGVIVFFKERNK